MRRPLGIALLLAFVGACAAQPEGPADPIAIEQFSAGTALDASASRQAVVDFVDAYAASPTEGAGALANLVAGPKLSSWVRWLSVQHREFTGTIAATADIRDVEFVGEVATQKATTAAQVGLSASVTFEFSPDGADAFDRARILDGPVTLVRADTGAYLVYDLSRDGVPMSAGIQLFEDQLARQDHVRVRMDSLFMFSPNWQFNVVIENLGTEPIIIDPETAGLYVDGDRVEGVTTDSLVEVAPGETVDGILAFPVQDSAEGRVLTLAYLAGDGPLRFDFPLNGLVTVVPPPAPVSSSTVTGATA
jgi:hypothetical protein